MVLFGVCAVRGEGGSYCGEKQRVVVVPFLGKRKRYRTRCHAVGKDTGGRKVGAIRKRETLGERWSKRV